MCFFSLLVPTLADTGWHWFAEQRRYVSLRILPQALIVQLLLCSMFGVFESLRLDKGDASHGELGVLSEQLMIGPQMGV